MSLLKFWSICAVLLVVDRSSSQPCKWTQYQLRKLNGESIQLLTDMGGDFPLKCLEENVKLMFPEGAYNFTGESQYNEIASVAYDALRDVLKIFNEDLASTSWDPEKLELFRNKLFRQCENLQRCVRRMNGEGPFPSDDNGRLKSYFQRLNTFLKEKEQSACAWEVVRKDVLYSLKKLQEFLVEKKQ